MCAIGILITTTLEGAMCATGVDGAEGDVGVGAGVDNGFWRLSDPVSTYFMVGLGPGRCLLVRPIHSGPITSFTPYAGDDEVSTNTSPS